MTVISKAAAYIKNPEKRLKLIFAAGIVGILLIVLSDFFPSGDETAEINASSGSPQDFESAQEYRQSLEKELAEILSSIDGVGEVQVMVNLSTSWQYVYVTQTDKSKSTDTDGETTAEKNEIILSQKQNTAAPIPDTIEAPAIGGAAVVCTGADDPIVRERVINTVSAALGISSSKVSVETKG